METIVACSGPGAWEVMVENVCIGYTHATILVGVSAVSVIVARRMRHWAVPAILLCLIVVHPAWTVSAYKGDCGFLKRDASCAFTFAGGIALFWQVTRQRRPISSPPNA